MSFIFVYGRPGSGKTTLVASMTKLGYKVLLIDVDNKAKDMQHLKPLVDNGSLVIVPVEAKLTEVTLKQRIMQPALALAKQPKGYIDYCNIISELESTTEHECQVVATDSLTSLIEHLKRLISYLQKKDKFTFDEWGILLTNLEEYFYTMMALQRLFKHVIITAHEQVEKDEDTGRIISILPAIEGSMRNKVSKYFTEVYRTIVEKDKAGAHYRVMTSAFDKCDARTSRGLEIIEEADFSHLYKEEKK